MKAYIEQLLSGVADPINGRNLVREYLQARILESLQRAGAMVPLAFHGGTALRFLYTIPRFSEDLDFALERSQSSYDFRAYLRAMQAEFKKEGYQVGIKLNDRKMVNSAFVRFNDHPYPAACHFTLTAPRSRLANGRQAACFIPTPLC